MITKVCRSTKKDKLKVNDASVSEGDPSYDEIMLAVPTVSEGDPNNNVTAVSEGCSVLDDGIIESNVDNTTMSSQTRDGSIAQTKTRSGRISVTLKRLMKAAFLGLLSCQIGSNVNESTEGLHSISMFQAQMKCNEITNLLSDETLNK